MPRWRLVDAGLNVLFNRIRFQVCIGQRLQGQPLVVFARSALAPISA
ncbi:MULTISPECIES: hypothetical protein [Planktothricoides]|nr:MULTISPECIES: hypothetical protein [Planktothricoides]MBD2583443.1 hypothetical protein [Planktothricoides raciborskii FACHB-1261]